MKKLLVQLSNATLRIQIGDTCSTEIKISEESEVETFKRTMSCSSTNCSERNSSHREPDNSSFCYPDNLGREEAVKDKKLESSSFSNVSIVAQESLEQPCATTRTNNCKETACNQTHDHITNDTDNLVLSSVVRVDTRKAAARHIDRAAPDGETRRNRNKRRRKKGGWKSRCGLYWSEVKRATKFNKLAMEAGLPLNRFVSIHPPASILALGDAVTKQWLREKAKQITQTVRGRSSIRQVQVPCITVYHKNRGGSLHCHMLLHVTEGNSALKRIADGTIINVKRAIWKHINYITKHRLPLSPEFEATTTHRRTASDPIRGVLLSFNKDAKLIWKIVGLISETKNSAS
jgi:hypothetical protein